MSKSTRTISNLMTEEAKQARREYARQWRLNNPDKVRATLARYWERKAKAAQAAATAEQATD